MLRDRQIGQSMKISVARIALWSLLLAAVAGGLLWRWLDAQRRPVPEVVAQPRAFPVFDIASPPARDAAAYLVQGTRNHADGRWLGARCRQPDPAEGSSADTFVMTRSGRYEDGPWRNDRLVVVLEDGGAVVTATAWPNPHGIPPVERWATLDAAGAREFRRLLEDSVFMRAPAGDGIRMCHAETITMEWCSQGRYYGVVRTCEVYEGRQHITKLADAIEVFVSARDKPLP
jgi:hypothetical protein